MNVNKKTVITTFTMILIITMSALMANIQSVNAAEVDTYSYISVAPAQVGVDQTVTVLTWLNHAPPTAAGPQGDRWENLMVKVTKPDGTIENKGPFTTDDVGARWFAYTPTQIGMYTMQMTFPGQTLTGIPGNEDHQAVGDYYKPSISRVIELAVQEEPIVPIQDAPIPDYWKRPLYAENRELWQLGSNWLMLAYDTTSRSFDAGSAFAPINNSPNSGHILWTKPISYGGLIGEEQPTVNYYSGLSYESKFQPIIINGYLFYSVYSMRDTARPVGYLCVDLQTGEEVYYQDETQVTFGQILDYETPNQHGGDAYLWKTPGRNDPEPFWKMYDAFTGEYMLSIANVTSGTTVFGPSGELLVYNIDDNQLIVWNSTKTIPPSSPTGSGFWQWRPWNSAGEILDGNNGIEMNITLAEDPSIRQVQGDVIYAQSGDTFYGYDRWTGAKLWSAELNRPEYPGGAYRSASTTLTPYRIHDDVYVEYLKETMVWYGYDVKTGKLLWGPTEPYASDWGYYNGYTGRIGAYGNFYSAGYDGIVHAFDISTGEVLWEYFTGDAGFETPYGWWPFYGGLTIADGKIFAATGEHSPGTPMWKGEKLHVMDAFTGEPLWNISGWYQASSMAVADGKLVAHNLYDNQLYCFGKGPSAITIEAPLTAITQGDTLMLTGTVTDQTPASIDTPAISDEDMSAWMGYLHQQKPLPTDANGVEVTIDVIDSNGNFRNIGTATTDLTGTYGLMWTPDIPGQYTVIATFAGSESYGSSFAQSYLGVVEAPAAESTPTPTPAPMTDTYLTGSTIAILAGIAIAVFLILRKK